MTKLFKFSKKPLPGSSFQSGESSKRQDGAASTHSELKNDNQDRRTLDQLKSEVMKKIVENPEKAACILGAWIKKIH
jgi:hypothetical protein